MNLGFFFKSLCFFLLTHTICFANAETLIITGHQSRAPKIYLDDKAQPKGYLIEAMNMIGKELNLEIQYKLQNWPKAVDDAMSGKYAIIGFSLSNERLKHFDFSEEPLYYDKIILVTTIKNNMKFETYEDLKNKKIAAVRKTNYGHIFEKLVKEKGFEHVETYNTESQLELLLNNKIDAFLIGPGLEGLNNALKLVKNKEVLKRQHEFRILKKPFNLDPNYIAIHKSNNKKALLDKIDEKIRKLKSEGKFFQIYDEK